MIISFSCGSAPTFSTRKPFVFVKFHSSCPVPVLPTEPARPIAVIASIAFFAEYFFHLAFCHSRCDPIPICQSDTWPGVSRTTRHQEYGNQDSNDTEKSGSDNPPSLGNHGVLRLAIKNNSIYGTQLLVLCHQCDKPQIDAVQPWLPHFFGLICSHSHFLTLIDHLRGIL